LAPPIVWISRRSALLNLVSRLEGLCRPLGKAVLVSGAFAAETEAPLIALGTHVLRGIASLCAVFTLPED
jgi:adenylate cyclase